MSVVGKVGKMKEYYMISFDGLEDETFELDQHDAAVKEYEQTVKDNPDDRVELLKIRVIKIMSSEG